MKRRVFSYFMRLLAVAVAMTTVLITLLTWNLFEARTMEELRVEARMLEILLENGEVSEKLSEIQDALRVTWIAEDGTVIDDNQANVTGMDNHADRVEVAQALCNGEGKAVRESRTQGKNTCYYAVKLKQGGVLRVGRDAEGIWSLYRRSLPLVLILTGLMIGACALAAHVLTDRLVEPIRRLTADMEGEHSAASYPEIQPFVRTIRSQYDEILKNAHMRVEFTANVSHELKTPLTSISGYAELIENGMAEGEMSRHFAGEIRKGSNRLLALINDIIHLAQMDAPEQCIEREIVDLAQLAENTVNSLQLNAEKMQVTLQTQIRQGWISADKGLIEELLNNLCDNAIRYNVTGGRVCVEVRPVRDKVLLVVQDTGIGIDKKNQERVFERFYRVDKSRSKATGGTGLGLAIVKHIAAHHGAELSLHSELGVGTTITVAFERVAV